MVTVVDNPAAMAAYVGSKLGTSEWVALDQLATVVSKYKEIMEIK